jgi:murein DD-endopeptidase MepM/ murein hydrolase activator NlpD
MSSRFAWVCALAAPLLPVAGTAHAEPAEAPPAAAQTADTQVKLPRLSSRYGYRQDPLGEGHRFHAGIDIPGPAGAPVLASAAGVVTFAGSAGGYGRMVEIDHGGGLRTRYAHLAVIAVSQGVRVPVGAAIGRMGSTGRSTGTHLHFEVRRDGRAVDPLAYLSRAPMRPLPTPREWTPQEPHISDFAKARAQAQRVDDAQ